jgi:hypothetical protein
MERNRVILAALRAETGDEKLQPEQSQVPLLVIVLETALSG